jgi:hypothetical protein
MFKSDDFLTINWTDEFLKERIDLTRVWTTLDNGIEIHELQLNRIDEVMEMIKVNHNNQYKYYEIIL